MTSKSAPYVDVHTHLTHDEFMGEGEVKNESEVDAVVNRAIASGLGVIIVNGLEPISNRVVLSLAARHTVIKPALGIYPIDAVNDRLPPGLPFPVAPFDVDAELDFIEAQAASGNIFALGECGLDGYWVGPETFSRQEEVFERFISIAKKHQLPLIVHTRKLEQRAAEILAHHKVERVNFHCFGGKVKLAQRLAEEHGWWFSIPANAGVNEAFRKMLATLPPEKILTETDAPYLSPVKGQRNEPANVVGTVRLLAELRGWTLDQARELVWSNFTRLFSPI